MSSIGSRPNPPSYEVFWQRKYETEKKKSSWLRYALMWLVVIVVVALVLTAVGLCLHFFVFKTSEIRQLGGTGCLDKDSSSSDDNSWTTSSTTTNSISAATQSPPISTPPSPTVTNQTISIPLLFSDSVDLVNYPSPTGDPAFLLFDFKVGQMVFIKRDGNVVSKPYSLTALQDKGCSSCRIHYSDETCQETSCDDRNTVYCCENCVKLSNSAFCNVFGDSTTISGQSPFNAGVYLPISSTTNQPYFIFNTKTKISSNTILRSFKYVSKGDGPTILNYTTNGLNFGDNLDSLQSFYRDFETQNGNELLFWQAYISTITTTSAYIKVTTSYQDTSPSFESCRIPTVQGDTIRLQLSSDNRSRLQTTVIKMGQTGTEIWACLAFQASHLSIPPQLIYSSNQQVSIQSISTNEDSKILILGTDLSGATKLIVFKIYWNSVI